MHWSCLSTHSAGVHGDFPFLRGWLVGLLEGLLVAATRPHHNLLDLSGGHFVLRLSLGGTRYTYILHHSRTFLTLQPHLLIHPQRRNRATRDDRGDSQYTITAMTDDLCKNPGSTVDVSLEDEGWCLAASRKSLLNSIHTLQPYPRKQISTLQRRFQRPRYEIQQTSSNPWYYRQDLNI